MLKNKIIHCLRYVNKFGFKTGITSFFKIHVSQKDIIQLSKTGSSPLYLRPTTTDKYVFDLIFLWHEYDFDVQLSKSPNIIDLGANIGLASLFFFNRYPTARIVSVEPSVENFEILKLNLGRFQNSIALNKAVWSKQAALYLKDNLTGGFDGFVFDELSEFDSESGLPKVDVVTIDEIMIQYQFDVIDVLKIDIEGAEQKIFESGYEVWLPKTKLIFIELHDQLGTYSARTFFSALCHYRFKCFFSKKESIICVNQDLY